MNKPDDSAGLTLRPRPAEQVVLSVPSDALASIREVAASRDMSPESLMQLYIGQGLRRDVARRFSGEI